jgi:hypothetical protein
MLKKNTRKRHRRTPKLKRVLQKNHSSSAIVK